MIKIRSVFIGNFSLPKKHQVYGLKNYAGFYNELANDSSTDEVDVFAGYLLPNEVGYDFSFEEQLSDSINFTLSKGNTPTTKLLAFIRNNLLLFLRLTFFSLKKGNYFIFLPSPMGVWSVLILTLFKRKKTLGIYIGGYYGREQAFEKRKGKVKKIIKKLAASIVDKLVVYSIKKSDYVITSSYEYYYTYNSFENIFLTPPLLNVEESDIQITHFKGEEQIITYCGEFRHAKGIVDLVKAFILLVKEGRIDNCKLKLIGSGQAEQELYNLVEQNEIKDLVIFCGQIKDRAKLKEELGRSTIFVLPSYSEGFPRVAYECFTLQVPTILTPVGGIPYFVKDKIHSLFTQPGDVEALAVNIENLIKDKCLQKKLKESAKGLMIKSVFPRIKTDLSLAKMIIKRIDNIMAK
jgi:glycosyltransferase involved in cell wall biosynthesis